MTDSTEATLHRHLRRLPIIGACLAVVIIGEVAQNNAQSRISATAVTASQQERTTSMTYPIAQIPDENDPVVKAVIDGMETVMGNMPDDSRRVPLNPQVVEELDKGTYVQRLLTVTTEPGSTTPVYLLVPKIALQGEKKCPAVLVLHSTQREMGSRVAVEEGANRNRDYGRQLAQQGFVVVAPSYPFMGGYQPNLAALGYVSGSMKALWDNRRMLDMLDSLPYVQPGGYGVIGHSLGGHNALFTALREPRIKAVVSSCGFDSFKDYMDGDLTGWTQECYMPRMANYTPDTVPFDFADIIPALAPRTVFISAPLHDTNFQWRSVAKIVQQARPRFEKLSVGNKLRLVHPDCGHDFPDDIRDEAFRVLRGALHN